MTSFRLAISATTAQPSCGPFTSSFVTECQFVIVCFDEMIITSIGKYQLSLYAPPLNRDQAAHDNLQSCC